MTIFIPVWVLWVIGVPLSAAAVLLMAAGVFALRVFARWRL